MKINCLIYALIDPNTNEIRYIGQTTKSLQYRLNQHINNAKYNIPGHLYNWIRNLIKNNKIPNIILLKENAEWNIDEINFISEYKKNGYNLVNATDGGDGTLGLKHSEEYKMYMSIIGKNRKHTEESKYKISCAHKNKIVSNETRKKFSLLRKGRKLNNEWKRKIKDSVTKHHGKSILCIETNIIYPSIKEAGRLTNLCSRSIQSCCKGKTKSCGGFSWQFVNKE